MAIATTNPATGEIEKTFEAFSDAEVDTRIARAAATFAELRATSFADRARWMNAAADALDEGADEIARVMTTEMGKTIVSARAEVTKCAKGCRFYAEHAEAMLADEPADAGAVGATRAYVRYEPLGTVLAVMPWNFPLWQVIRFAAPALMAGNVGLLKHASNVPQTALDHRGHVPPCGIPRRRVPDAADRCRRRRTHPPRSARDAPPPSPGARPPGVRSGASRVRSSSRSCSSSVGATRSS